MTTKSLQLVAGVPTMVTILPSIYSANTTLGSALTAGAYLTLPNSGTVVGSELEVRLNNVPQTFGVDWFVASSTQIYFSQNLNIGDVLTFLTLRNQ
jgi:hypothetical protein